MCGGGGKKNYMKEKNGICIITLSNNYDHQEVAFSMFNELYGKYNVYNIGLINQKNPRSPHTKSSFYFDAPRRPGINRKTFRFDILLKIVKKIKSLNVKYVYFESEHIWNYFIMKLLGKKYVKIEVIHDVIPHSDSKGKMLANKKCSKIADFVLIRNLKYKEDLYKLYKVKENKVIFMPLWRYYPKYSYNNNSNGFLFFGRIRKYKGIENMIEITKKCNNIRFYVVGAPDEESRIFVDELKKMSNVEVLDREVNDSEMEKYFRISRSVILPYESASQSGIIVDAYKYSKPVIAFDVGTISEQISNGQSGFLVEKDNLDEFCKKIIEINSLTDDSYENLCKQAYDYGYNKYSSAVAKNEFIKLFLK